MLRIMKRFVVCFIALTCAEPVLALVNSVQPSINSSSVSQKFGRPTGAVPCPPVAEPVTDMSNFRTMYDIKDPTQSHLDPSRVAPTAARGKAMMTFDNQMGYLSDKYVLSKPLNQAAADCVLTHMDAWAKADALNQNMDVQIDELGRHQAILEQAFHLAGIASAFNKVAAGSNDPRLNDIRNWLRRLAASVMREYTTDNRWSRAGGNHASWAAFAVTTTAGAVNDRAMFDFGMRWLARGIGEIDSEGALPDVKKRGIKAMTYQHFSLLPIAGLVAAADANGFELTSAQDQALRRAVAFTISQTKDPTRANELSKTPQPPTFDGNHLAWADLVLPYLSKHDPALAAQLDAFVRPLRPLRFVYMGGQITNVYLVGK